MKKVICTILLLFIIFASALPCFAADFINPDLPRVVDNAGVFTQSEIEELLSDINEFTEKYGSDILVLTETTNHGYSTDYGYIDEYWQTMGYGTGSDASGICFYLCLQPGDRFWYTEATGSCTEYVNYDTVNIVDDFITDYMINEEFAAAAKEWISQYSQVFERGAAKYTDETYSPMAPTDRPKPKAAGTRKLEICLAAAGVCGAAAGIINLVIGLVSMKSVALANNAKDYVKPGSFVLQNYHNILLHASVHRTPKNTDNSGGGGMGGSMHHSGGSSFSSHSFGGSSHSGGGRHF